MVSRYRIGRCRAPFCTPHMVVVGGNFPYYGQGVKSLPEAFRRIAKQEAHRLAGNDWALWEEGGRIRVQRQGSTRVTPWRSWGDVARFLAAMADAGRAPLVVTS